MKFRSLFIIPVIILSLFIGTIRAEQIFELSPGPSQFQFDFFNTPTEVFSYNGRIPGPVIRAQQGETITIDVLNRLSEPTSVHWHGLRIDNRMDGVPGVTQTPIKPGERFFYRLNLKEAGTYWYHPHFNAGEQIERGLKGALIIEDPDPLPWSRDIVWLIDDWLFQSDGSIFPYFNNPRDLMHNGRWGNVITVNGQYQPEIQVKPGERIRLRLINGANARLFYHLLKGLSPKVIAVDGRPVSVVFDYENFVLSPGNRVDLDITIPEEAAGKTFLLEDNFTREKIVIGKIKVTDKGPVVHPPRFEIKTDPQFIPSGLFDKVKISKTWELNLVRGGKFGIGWAMNQKLWPNSDRIDLPIGQPVKLRFKNLTDRFHPMHIHGTFFRVLEVNNAPLAEPFTRDTVLVGPNESVTIGLVPENNGIWLTHCHIQSHAESGMMTTINVE